MFSYFLNIVLFSIVFLINNYIFSQISAEINVIAFLIDRCKCTRPKYLDGWVGVIFLQLFV